MDTDNNHLIMVESGQTAPNGYTKVPDHLNRAARKKLAGKNEAYVSMTSGGKLSRWAKKQREARKKLAMSGKV